MVNDDYIARKERWARKMAGRPVDRGSGDERLPPGQHEVTDFPVLDLGLRPEVPFADWSLYVHGHVENPVRLDWEAFGRLPQFRDRSDFHCVTTWSQFDMEWAGVAFFSLAELVKPRSSASHVFFKGYDGYSTSNPLDVCLDDDVLLARSWNGTPLSVEHGGPVRVIIPKRYAWKGTKFVREIVFVDREILGFWELRGYSKTADPWTNDRFVPSKLP